MRELLRHRLNRKQQQIDNSHDSKFINCWCFLPVTSLRYVESALGDNCVAYENRETSSSHKFCAGNTHPEWANNFLITHTYLLMCVLFPWLWQTKRSAWCCNRCHMRTRRKLFGFKMVDKLMERRRLKEKKKRGQSFGWKWRCRANFC